MSDGIPNVDPLVGKPALQRARDLAMAAEWYDLVARIGMNWSRTRAGCAHGMMSASLTYAAKLARTIGMRQGDFSGLAAQVFRDTSR